MMATQGSAVPPTTVLNFIRLESDRMFERLAADAGVVGQWVHYRQVSPVDHQNIVRQNRDTLYSAAIVDISEGATLTVPDAGGRYVSVMVVNQDHYINEIFHDPGNYRLTVDDFDTEYVLLGGRVLVNPADEAEVAAAHAVQDGLLLSSGAARPFPAPVFDEPSFTATRNALIALARGLPGFEGAFGRKGEVDPIRHLLGTAAAWGGMPEHEAMYLNIEPGLPAADQTLTVPADVPVDAFWSVSAYDAAGYFVPNDADAYSVNSVTADRNGDGSVTISFGPGIKDVPNHLPVVEGWNYMVRLYRPRPEVLDGTWTFPTLDV